MGWGQVVGAVVSAYGASQSNKNGKKKSKLEDQALQQQMDLARRQGEISEEQYQFWLQNYKPLALEAISEARRDITPDYAAIQADNAGAYNAQRGDMERKAQRYGMNPADGAFGASLARIGADEAKSLVFNRNRAREGAKGQKLSNLMGAYGMGSGMPGLAAQTAAQAGAGFGNAAGAYGAGAQNAYAQAQQDAAGWGNFVSSIPWQQLMSNGGAAQQQPAAAGAGNTAQPGPWAGGYTYPSSREWKHDISPVDPQAALDIVNQTPVASYAYDGSQEPQLGTVAEEAPPAISNGQKINPMNQIGALTGAVQALSQQVTGSKSKKLSNASATTVPYSMKSKRGGEASATPGRRRNFGTRIMDGLVPDRGNDGRRGAGDWAAAAGNGVLNYATGGLWGLGRRAVGAIRNRRGRNSPTPSPGYPSMPNEPWNGQPWSVPNYGGPPQNYPGSSDPSWGMPDYMADPGQRQMTDAERRQQLEQFDRYSSDPSSIYYQGPRGRGGQSNSPMTDAQLGGPLPDRYRSPVRETFESYSPRTGSGEGFQDAVDYYRSIQRPSEDFER